MKTKKATKFFLTLVLATTLVVSLNSFLKAAATDEVKQQEPKVLKQEVVKLKYVEAGTLRNLLVPYFGPDTRISADNKSNVLTVSDNPENLEKILAAIRKIDVQPKDLVFTIQLIIASEAEGPTDPELKNDPLVKELKKLLRFKSFQLLDATMVRAIDRKESMINFGPNNQFEILLKPEVAEGQPSGNIKLNVTLRQRKEMKSLPSGERFWVTINPVTLIDSHLSLKSGDRTVVGVSRMNVSSSPDGDNKGLILIISGKIAF
ncbi:MAG: hypothetical protein H5U05_08580 [Candidatus Aminicenantes bacterium]|nr:hypothetical protein [Candidatus Aminicenantes bacterium]